MKKLQMLTMRPALEKLPDFEPIVTARKAVMLLEILSESGLLADLTNDMVAAFSITSNIFLQFQAALHKLGKSTEERWNKAGIRHFVRLNKQEFAGFGSSRPKRLPPPCFIRFARNPDWNWTVGAPPGAPWGKRMKGSQKTLAFIKTAACPASTTLLSFSSKKLSPKVVTVVEEHLETCEFCNAELPLLAHHRRENGGRRKVPEIPMNLRILAESILSQVAKVLK